MSYQIAVGTQTAAQHHDLLDAMTKIDNINQELDDLEHRLGPLMEGQSGAETRTQMAHFRSAVQEAADQHKRAIQHSLEGAEGITAADNQGLG
ncbi:hypothetical protein MUNTM_45580 [Mycobacterium sp. MUNTM1]